MKRLTATFNIESDLQEYQLRQTLEGLGAKYLKTMPSYEHLKENPHYKKMYKAKKEAEINLYNFIDKNRNN